MSLSPNEVMALELASARAWPAARVSEIGGWRLHAASGYSGRINACWPLEDPVWPCDAAIGMVEAWYHDQRLPPRFKVVDGGCAPLDLPDHLLRQGYESQTETLMMVAPTGGTPAAELWIGDALDERFEEVFAASGMEPGDGQERLEALNRVPPPRAFAVLSVGETPAAIGAAAVEAEWCGLFAMRTSPGFRRRGLAARVLGGLMAWGAERGASRTWLQVEAGNPGAIALYRGAGFTESYRYRYWLKRGRQAEIGASPAL